MMSPPAARPPVELYCEARNYIDVEIVRHTPRRRTPGAKVETALEFNRSLSDPQAAYPSVQIAGTSGKGSVAHYLSRILKAAGQKTGLHISPYLQVATEKTWVDGKYASAELFHRAYLEVKPVTEAFRYRHDCPASVHGMASLALSYCAFREEAVDWCVMETGLGGRFDLVQGLDRRLAVITEIGYDHIESLGPGLKDIAWHKAGIMAGAPLALAVYSKAVWRVFEDEARRCGCELRPLHPDDVVSQAVRSGADTLVFRLPRLGEVEIPRPQRLFGYPVRNMAVAASAADALAESGCPVTPAAVAEGLTGPPLPGRMEVLQQDPMVMLDAAHNEQKMGALGGALTLAGRRLIIVFGATGLSRGPEMLSALPQKPDAIITTRPQLYGKKTVPPSELARRARGLAPQVEAAPNPRVAIEHALRMAEPEDLILVTGSVYLAGQVRDRWFKWQDVLLQRTPFPRGKLDESNLITDVPPDRP